MTDEFDPFAGTSGLLDDYNGTVVDAWFAKDAGYNSGETLLLCLKMSTDNPDTTEVENRYACGPEWDSFDGGDTAEHPKTPMFNANSQIMQFVVAAFDAPPTTDKTWDMGGKVGVQQISDAQFLLRTRGYEVKDATGKPLGPRNAKIWIGTSWHWIVKTETKKFKDRQTGEMIERTSSRPFPTEFLGLVDVGVGGAGTDEFAGTASPGLTSPPQPGATAAPGPGAPQPGPAPAAPTPTQPAAAPSAPAPAPSAPATPAAPSAPAPAAPAAPTTTATASQDPVILSRVKILAETLPYPQWVDEVLNIPGVATDENFVAALGTEDYYNQLRGSATPA